jgi:predicted  nucleic acid-binding Zn-ribbon protein
MKKKTSDQIDCQLKDRPIARIGEYVNTKTPIEWKCLTCNNIWLAAPDNVLNKNSGCPRCSVNKLTDDKLLSLLDGRFIINTESINNKSVNSRISWKCLRCDHQWKSTAYNVINKKRGCSKCYHTRIKNRVVAIEDELVQRGICLLDEEVNNASHQLNWLCLRCNTVWAATYNNVINHTSGCPVCTNRGYSRKAIDWINEISREENISIVCAEGGEYLIPNTQLKVDGYCSQTNTIYEFYGDYWHGNPEKFNPNDTHPHIQEKTFGDLYDATLMREEVLRELGYNIITTWESDYDTRKKEKKSKLPKQ